MEVEDTVLLKSKKIFWGMITVFVLDVILDDFACEPITPIR
jgi:hypothetical protein